MKRLIFAFLFLISALAHGQNVRVAAAANLRYVLDEIKTAYVADHPGTAIDVVYGSSGSLVQQILNGAQFNLFLSADRDFPEKLKAAGAASGEVRTYAYGKIALWSGSLDVKQGPGIVTDRRVKSIAIAKPDVAPYGDRAVQMLKHYGLYDSVKSKIVFAENISQAAQFAQTGNADIGIIALSLTLAPEMKDAGTTFIPDSASYAPVDQACVLVKTWERNSAAGSFMEYILSAAAKPFFEKYGYTVQ